MKAIDGKKVERVCGKIYDIFIKEKVTSNEGSAIAGLILANASANTAAELIKRRGG